MNQISTQKSYIFNWKGALALIGGMFIGTAIIALANVISTLVFKINLQYEDYYMIITNAAGFLAAIFCFDYFVVRPETGRKLNFNFSTSNFVTYILIFPMMLGMMFIGEFFTSQIPVSGPIFGDLYELFTELMAQMSKDEATLILLAVIMAPLFEEIIFRGIIQKGLINKGVNPYKAIFISAIVFGVIHGNPWQFVGAVLLGSVLGLVYYKTKSLLLPILLHAFNNLCSALLIFYGETESFAETFKVSELMILGIGVIIFSISLYFFLSKYKTAKGKLF